MSLRTARAHQIKALHYASGQHAPALFMEMRLGKTMVAIRWANTRFGKHLVVAPLTVLASWYEELIKENYPAEKITYLLGSSAKKLELSKPGKAGWYLVGYEALRACPELLRAGWRTVILDESTKIRNPKAQISKLLYQPGALPTRRAILSGMPAPEGAFDYFTQFKILDGHFMGCTNYWVWRDKLFYLPSWSQWDWQPRPGTLVKIRQYLQKRAFVLTRKEAGMDREKVYEKRYVAMTPEQKKMYKQIESEFSFGDDLEKATKWATVKFVWLQRLAGGFDPTGKEVLSMAKAEEILKLLQGELKGQKLIVWFCFNSELQATFNFLTEKGFKCRKITGEENLAQRKKATEDLNSGNAQVILAQIKCGKFGLNWSAADVAVYYSNRWDGEDRAQSEDRIMDIGVSGPLLYIDLCTENSLDVDVIETLKGKYTHSRYFMTKLIENWLLRKKLSKKGVSNASGA